MAGGVRGFVGQSMRGARPKTNVSSYSYPSGSYTWTCPRTGPWRLVLWGGGGSGSSAGGTHGASGSYYEAIRNCVKGQAVALSVGGVQGATTATFPSGEVLTAGGASTTTPGTASAKGTDIAYNGSPPGVAGLGNAGGTAANGGGAPGNGNYRGGNADNGAPGAGGSASSNSGSPGLALVVPVRV